nr:tyrosine-type recombinase/integrase [uncultured Albidiferax sp.]
MSEAKSNALLYDVRNYGRPPQASAARPFRQLEWAFDQYGALKGNPETKYNYVNAKRLYIRILEALEFKGPFILEDQWNEFALIKLREDIEKFAESKKIGFSSYTRIGFFSAARCVMRLVCAKGLLRCNKLLDVVLPNPSSETKTYSAYSDPELVQLLDALAGELDFSRRVLSGYRPQSHPKGRDPREEYFRGAKLGYGFGVEDNMRWYFEHVLECRPITSDEMDSHHGFLAAASNQHGGLHNLYRRWGVSASMGLDVIMPLVVQLSYLTGLNPGSLRKLRTDCFIDKHELTGTPYLRAWKLRSGGEYNLDLELLDDDDTVEAVIDDKELYEEDLRPLQRKQAVQVERTVKLLLTATEHLRSALPEGHPYKDRLFIYTSLGNSCYYETIALSAAQTSRWCRSIVHEYQLLNDNGELMQFNLVRFRSTKLTEMARQGRDLHEIQVVANHKSVATTIGYIYRKKLAAAYTDAIVKALTQIHGNRAEFEQKKNCSSSSEQPIQIYRGLLSDCKNVFDPPRQVQLAKSYKKGQACSRFNMCLFCKNVLVFREHLPTLISYLGQINVALENNVHNVPNASLYEDSKGIIEELIDPERGEFSAEDINWARSEAASIEVLIDTLLFRGVA